MGGGREEEGGGAQICISSSDWKKEMSQPSVFLQVSLFLRSDIV